MDKKELDLPKGEIDISQLADNCYQVVDTIYMFALLQDEGDCMNRKQVFDYVFLI